MRDVNFVTLLQPDIKVLKLMENEKGGAVVIKKILFNDFLTSYNGTKM